MNTLQWDRCRLNGVLYPRLRSIGMNVGIALVILLTALGSVNSQPSEPREKHKAIYAPPPEYPLGARQRHWTGKGLFLCNLRPDGTVSSVKILQSTGHEILDQAGTSALGRWRFQPGDMNAVKIPLRFTMSGVRHRMAGAVISD